MVFIVYLKLLKCPIEDNKALRTASDLLVRAIIKQLSLWSALMTASYLLSVLSSVITGCLDMSGGVCSLFKVLLQTRIC